MRFRITGRTLLATTLVASMAISSSVIPTGCSVRQAGQTTLQMAVTPVSAGRDRTISVKDPINPSDYSKVEKVDAVYCYAEAPTWKNLSKSSTLVATGEIVNIDYTTFGTQAVSKADVKIRDVVAGDAESGDTISIFMGCGYIPLKDTGYTGAENELEDTIVEYVPEEMELPKLGEISMFFLEPLDSYKREWSGGFSCVFATYRLHSSDGGKTFAKEGIESENEKSVTVTAGEAKQHVDIAAVEKNAAAVANKR